MKTENTGQVSVGVVKAPGIPHEKIATQHPAEWHLIEGREFTLVTTRNSGTSCFNLVELQNGVDGRADANLFIPSTWCGSAETEPGRISQERLQENMEAALQVYLDRVNEIPFGSYAFEVSFCRTPSQPLSSLIL